MYHIYMGSVLLPIAPESISLKVQNANKTVTLINEGEVNFLRSAGLTDVEFDALIPATQYTFAKYDGGFKSPSYFLDYFENLKTSKKPFSFTVSRMMPNGKLLFDTTMDVSLESYTVKEQAKEGFDLIIQIKLKQYRYFATNVLQVSGNTATVVTQRDTNTSPAPKKEETYTVKENDTLWNIAKKVYGDGSQYTRIQDANKGIAATAAHLETGTRLKIPKALNPLLQGFIAGFTDDSEKHITNDSIGAAGGVKQEVAMK